MPAPASSDFCRTGSDSRVGSALCPDVPCAVTLRPRPLRTQPRPPSGMAGSCAWGVGRVLPGGSERSKWSVPNPAGQGQKS